MKRPFAARWKSKARSGLSLGLDSDKNGAVEARYGRGR